MSCKVGLMSVSYSNCYKLMTTRVSKNAFMENIKPHMEFTISNV